MIDKGIRFIQLLAWLAGLAALIGMIWLFYVITGEAHAIGSDVRRTARALADYTEAQTEQLRSARNIKAIDAGIAAAASFQATARSINTIVIPKAVKTLDSLDRSAEALTAMIQRTDESVNVRLLPAATADLASLQTATDELTQRLMEFKSVNDEASKSFNSITNLLNDRDLASLPGSLASSFRNVEMTTAEILAASRELPSTARNIERISKSSARWRWLVLSSQVGGPVMRAFF